MRWLAMLSIVSACGGPAARPATTAPATAPTTAAALGPESEDVEIRTETDRAKVTTARVVVLDPGALPRAALRLAPGDHDVAVRIAVDTREIGGGAPFQATIDGSFATTASPVQADRLFAGLWIAPSDHKAMTMFLDRRARILSFFEVGDEDRIMQPVIADAIVPLPEEAVGAGARWRTRDITQLEDRCAVEESIYRLTSLAHGRPVIDGDIQILALAQPCASVVDASRALVAVRGRALTDAPHVDGVGERITLHAEMDLAAPLAGTTALTMDARTAKGHSVSTFTITGTASVTPAGASR